MALALFGGTFNPVHTGHLLIAKTVSQIPQVNRIVFMPNFLPTYKDAPKQISPQNRLEMLHLGVKEYRLLNKISIKIPWEISDWEIKQQKPSYTVDTLRSWPDWQPEADNNYFVIGADSAFNLPLWREWEEIVRRSHFLVYQRDGVGNWMIRLQSQKNWKLEYSEKFQILEGSFISISSSDIRSHLHNQDKCVRSFLPDAVYEYIVKERLYR